MKTTISNKYSRQSKHNKITVKFNGRILKLEETPYVPFFQSSTPEMLKKNQIQRSKKNIVEMLMMDGLEELEEIGDFETLR